MIIDSFLLSDGRVTGFDRHIRRFGQATGIDSAAFIRDFCATAPQLGQWFPQWRYQDNTMLWVLRPAPLLTSTLRLGSVIDDERSVVQLKGPDLEWLTTQVDVARSNGADDVLLVGPEGVRETGTCALVIWEDRQWLSPRVAMPSCTMEWFVQHQKVMRCDLSVSDVMTAAQEGRVLALNSLHGVRKVVVAKNLQMEPSSQMQDIFAELRRCWFAEAEPVR
ncbi:MAG: aminotransferase class IV [Propionibacteriaceae bacterium]